MRILISTLLVGFLALGLGACGGDDSNGDSGPAVTDPGTGGGDGGGVPAAVDPSGMTKEQLEAKIEEIEGLIEEKMAEMGALAQGRQPGQVDPEMARKAEAMSADLRALQSQLKTYDEALDKLER
jgi:hypothetical protein